MEPSQNPFGQPAPDAPGQEPATKYVQNINPVPPQPPEPTPPVPAESEQPGYQAPPAPSTTNQQSQQTTVYGQFQPVYSGSVAPTQPLPPGSNSRKKIIFASLAASLGILLLTAGVVFGLYLPNKPENVYSTGINRTGKMVDKFVASASEQKKLENYKNSELSGTLEVNGGDTKVSGSFNSRYDIKNSDSSIKYKNAGEGQDFSAQLLTSLADKKTYPDIYFKLSGLANMGLNSFIPGIEQYDNKWVSVSSDYLSTVIPAEDNQKPNEFSQQDAAELAQAASATTKEYVFSTDKDKAVFEQRQFVGTEKIENNIQANHYTVGVNRDNAKKYCKALIENVTATNAYKKIPGVKPESIEKDKQTAISNCEQSTETNLKRSDTFDMWVDKKHKLISKVRISDATEKGTYVDIGQTYQKGDIIPLYVTFHSDRDKYDAKMTLDVDVEKSTTKGTINLNFNEEVKYSVTANFEFKPYSGSVKVEAPKDAVPIQDVMRAMNVSPDAIGAASPGVNAKAKDSKRKADIMSLHTQLEVFYANNGFYPSAINFNDASWRKTNMPNLDEESLKDPDGSSSTLAGAATATQYGYAAECSRNRSQCTSYMLSAKLSDGTIFSKKNLD